MFDRIKYRIRAMLGKSQMERDLNEELGYHLEEAIRQNIARGLSPEEARREALIGFGGVEQIKESSRDARGFRFLSDLWRDLRFSARMLRKNAGFTLTVIATLALGVGANTAIFSLVDAVLLRPLPFAEADQLAWITEKSPDGLVDSVSDSDLAGWQDHHNTLSGVEGWADDELNMTGNGEPARVYCWEATNRLLPLLGVKAVIGRDFSEITESGEPVAMLGEKFWRERFGGATEVIGASIILSDKRYTIIGVAPRSLDRLEKLDVLVPLAPFSRAIHAEYPHTAILVNAVGRLEPGVEPEAAEAELNSRWQNVESRTEANRPRVRMSSLRRYLIGDVRMALLILFAAVGFVLLIASANVANMMLARSTAREGEFAVRAALGAGRWRLIRQLLAESMVLAALGGTVGAAVGALAVHALAPALPRGVVDSLGGLQNLKVDGRVLGFTILVAVLTGMLFGLAPALTKSRVDVNESLKAQGRFKATSVGLRSFRGWLIITEIALSLILLAGAGLMVKSFGLLRAVKLGFRPENVITFQITLPQSRYPGYGQVSQFTQQVLDRVGAVDDVRSAGVANSLPLGGFWLISALSIEGHPVATGGRPPAHPACVVTPGYFSTMGIPIVAGRAFDERDRLEGIGLGLDQPGAAPDSILVNEAFARTYWPDENPIGKRVGNQHVIGVVGDFKQQGMGDEVKPEIFRNGLQRLVFLAVHSQADRASLIAAVRAEVQAVDKDQPISVVKSMDDYVAESLGESRFYALALSTFSIMSLLLAAFGIYGLISYSVVESTKEIGLRMALGATERGVLGMLIRRAMVLLAGGITIGLLGALGLTRLLSSYLYGVGARDTTTLLATILILACVALVACFIPARRAARLDPVAALRHD